MRRPHRRWIESRRTPGPLDPRTGAVETCRRSTWCSAVIRTDSFHCQHRRWPPGFSIGGRRRPGNDRTHKPVHRRSRPACPRREPCQAQWQRGDCGRTHSGWSARERAMFSGFRGRYCYRDPVDGERRRTRGRQCCILLHEGTGRVLLRRVRMPAEIQGRR